jgi:hypothetical protein
MVAPQFWMQVQILASLSHQATLLSTETAKVM